MGGLTKTALLNHRSTLGAGDGQVVTLAQIFVERRRRLLLALERAGYKSSTAPPDCTSSVAPVSTPPSEPVATASKLGVVGPAADRGETKAEPITTAWSMWGSPTLAPPQAATTSAAVGGGGAMTVVEDDDDDDEDDVVLL
eukprot:NODE_5627_length_497_cov_193.421875_g4204_i0.p1 GENE.NODE_5627_length_497_cov_193.421875_g4204_i0~~NODE_5627_length_497_cov_193.421875_g4204_i0.p1  ORF type:complete len:149 (+),score=18.30 NODE_5627_length_497_cov_193.421875_g4204_i0:27-449(+)